MAGDPGTQAFTSKTGILIGVLLTHACLFILFISPALNSVKQKTNLTQAPAPLPMAIVELVETQPIPSSTLKSKQVLQENMPLPTLHQASKAVAKRTVMTPKAHSLPQAKTIHQATANTVNSFTPSPTAITATHTETIPTNLHNTQSSATNTYPLASDNHHHSDNTSSHGSSSGSKNTSQSSDPMTSSPSFGAAYLNNPAPQYPAKARQNKEEGKVLLRVLVTANGLAKQVNLHASSGSEALDQSAIKAVKKWRFVPAKQGNETVEGWVQIPLVFKLDT